MSKIQSPLKLLVPSMSITTFSQQPNSLLKEVRDPITFDSPSEGLERDMHLNVRTLTSELDLAPEMPLAGTGENRLPEGTRR